MRQVERGTAVDSDRLISGVWYLIVTCQLAKARTVDCCDRWKERQIDRTSKAILMRSSRSLFLLPFSLGFPHGIFPQC